MNIDEGYFRLLIFFIVVAFLGVVFAIFEYRKWIQLKDIPRSKIRSVAMGIVEIHGTPFAKKTVIAPLTGEECYFWKYEIKEGRGFQNSSYKTVYTAYSDSPLILQDETGRVRIEPEGLEFDIASKREYYYNRPVLPADTEVPPGQETEDMLTEGDAYGNDRMHLVYTLKQHDQLVVLGTAKSNKDGTYIAKGKNNPLFTIANGTEANIIKRVKHRWIVATPVGIVSTIIVILMVIGLF